MENTLLPAKTAAQPQKTVFSYHNFPITFEIIDGEVYADATEMCRPFSKRPVNWLDLPTTKRYIAALEAKSENLTLVFTQRGKGTWVSEKLILKLAQWLDVDFDIWCVERIAELLRTGKTEIAPPQHQIPQTYSEALYVAYEQAVVIENQQKLLTEAAPKLEVYEATMNADGNVSVQEAAKVLGIGPKQIFATLRDMGIFYFNNGHNLPKQSYIDKKWFKVKNNTFWENGKEYIYPRIFVTPKGVDGLYNLLNR